MRRCLCLFVALGFLGLTGMGTPGPGGAQEVSVEAVCGTAPPPSGGTPSEVEGGFHPVEPTRLLDTRFTIGKVLAGCTVVLDTLNWVPADATAVALDVVAVEADGPGFVTAYPCDAERPLASNLNTRSGVAVPNAAIVPLEAGRRVCFFTSVGTQLVVDLTGWFGVGGEPFHGLTPDRILDTRFGPRPDGGTGRFAFGSTTTVPVAGVGPVPSDATGIVVNATVTDTDAPGFLVLFPCGDAVPLASNVNYGIGDTRANQALVGLDGSGAVCVYTQSTASVILDVSGWFGGSGGARLLPIVGTRVLDSRDGTGGWSTPIGPGETRAFDVTRDGSLPVGQNVALNVVATEAQGTGYLTLFPCGTVQPPTSSLNYHVGDDVTNVAVVPVGDGGQVCAYSQLETHVVVDVVGSLGAPGALLQLAVSGGPLMPAFTPDGRNYGVVCQPGVNTWTVTTNPVHAATVAVAGADPSGTVSLSEGDAMVVTVTEADATATEYWVRCLPNNFPVLDVARRDVPTPGWYLVAPMSSPYVVILDSHGAPVWYQDTGAPAIDLKLLPNGNLSWVHLLGPSYGLDPDAGYVERTLDGTEVRTWRTVGAPTDHHDLVPLENGDMLMVSYHPRSGVDVSALGPGYPSPSDVTDTWIQQITPAGTVAWEWRSEDHIGVAETVAQVENPNILVPPAPAPFVLDLVHANSLDVDPATGDVIVSARHLDAVFAIRRNPGQPDDGRVLWKLGGNAPTDPATAHLTVIDDPDGGPRRQHDARLLPNGNLTVFDNQSFHAGASSRGAEYALDLVAGTATLVGEWSHPSGGQAFGLGSTRRSVDGSTVVGWGAVGPLLSDYLPSRPDRATLVVTASGAINYRALKLDVDAFDEAQLRATAGS